MLDVIGTRPADQMVSRTVRITLGGEPFELPVRSIRFNREWKERLNGATAVLLDSLSASGDDRTAIVAAFDGHEADLIDALVSYAPGALSRDAIEDIEPDATWDVLTALREVWRAASPLVVIGVAAAALTPTPPSSPPTSSPRRPTAGRRSKSKTN